MPIYKATYLCNILHSKFIEGYTEGALLMDAGVTEFDAPSAAAALEQAWMFWNADDRPNGQTAPSLSMGDVVRLEYNDVVTDWAVEGLGWRLIVDARIYPNREDHTIPEAMHLVREIAAELLDRMDHADDEVDVDAITALGQAEPLPQDDARRLYSRIIGILRPGATEEQVDTEVTEILDTQTAEGVVRP